MAEKFRTEKGGKVLQFAQDGEFYYRSGSSKLEKNDLTGAIASYRMALKLDPKNYDAVLGIAEILTAMGRTEESNRLLMVKFREEERPAEAYFGMGCNFFAQREYDQARMSFDKYLDEDPEGEFAYTAYDMAEAIDDGTAQAYQDGPFAVPGYTEAEQARRLMEKEDFKGAIELLEKTVEEHPELSYARNNLALCYYCVHDYDKATDQVGAVLKEEPQNIQAHCNLAIFMRGAKDDVGLKRQVDYLKTVATEDADDLNRLCVTFMDLREFAVALPIAKKLYNKKSFDPAVIHRLGLCAYYTGEWAYALSCYDKLIKIDGEDSIARFYRGICKAAIMGAPKAMSLMLNYQVPAEEVIARIKKLNEYIHIPREKLMEMWKEGGDVRMTAKWGLTLPDQSVKRAILSFIASFRDETAEEILRDFALRKEESTDLKRDTFAMLKAINAREPYLSYIDGELVESRVSLMPVMPKGLPKAYGEVMENCVDYMRGIRDDRCISTAVKLWGKYVNGLSSYPPISNGQKMALAAALEYEACRKCGVEVTKLELCSKYGISMVRFNNAMGKLNKGESKE